MCFVFGIVVFEVSKHFKFLKYCHASLPQNRHFYFAVLKNVNTMNIKRVSLPGLAHLTKYTTKGNTSCESNMFPGFPGGASGKGPACQCSRCKRRGFHPWVRKIPWKRVWQLTPVFLPGGSHGQRSLVGCI